MPGFSPLVALIRDHLHHNGPVPFRGLWSRRFTTRNTATTRQHTSDRPARRLLHQCQCRPSLRGVISFSAHRDVEAPWLPGPFHHRRGRARRRSTGGRYPFRDHRRIHRSRRFYSLHHRRTGTRKAAAATSPAGARISRQNDLAERIDDLGESRGPLFQMNWWTRCLSTLSFIETTNGQNFG